MGKGGRGGGALWIASGTRAQIIRRPLSKRPPVQTQLANDAGCLGKALRLQECDSSHFSAFFLSPQGEEEEVSVSRYFHHHGRKSISGMCVRAVLERAILFLFDFISDYAEAPRTGPERRHSRNSALGSLPCLTTGLVLPFRLDCSCTITNSSDLPSYGMKNPVT